MNDVGSNEMTHNNYFGVFDNSLFLTKNLVENELTVYYNEHNKYKSLRNILFNYFEKNILRRSLFSSFVCVKRVYRKPYS